MPYPNEYSCRLHDPSNFKDPWIRVKRKSKSVGKTYSVVRGTSKASGKFEDQAYRYSKDTWSASEAKSHCKAHKGSHEADADIQKVDAIVAASEATSLGSNEAVRAQLITRLINVPLMIAPDRMELILNAVGPSMGLSIDADWNKTPLKHHFSGRRIVDDSVAIVEVYDTLFHHGGGFLSFLFGGTSYEDIRTSFRSATEDDSIKTTVLLIDSPGGEVPGVFDLAEDIYNARNKKPIIAVANESIYSAAYLIASAAHKIYVPRTGIIGSIGVIAIHVDTSEMEEKMGVKYTSIYAGAKKDARSRHKPLSEEAFKDVKAEVDKIYELFVDTVARNRNISAEAVKATEAATFLGDEGIKVGLVDEVLSWDGVMETFSLNYGGIVMPDKLKGLKENLDTVFKDISAEQRGELFTSLGFVSQTEIDTLKASTKTLQDQLKAVKKRDEDELKTIREEIEKEVHKKSGTEKLQAEVDQLKLDAAAAKTAIADAKKETLAEKERSRKMELMTQVKEIGLPGDNAKRVEMIFALEKTQPDMAKDYIEQMKKDAALVKDAGLFKELGAGGDGNAGSAVSELDAKVQELMKDGKMTKIEAMQKAARDNPDLYNRYSKEQKGG